MNGYLFTKDGELICELTGISFEPYKDKRIIKVRCTVCGRRHHLMECLADGWAEKDRARHGHSVQNQRLESQQRNLVQGCWGGRMK